MDEKKTSEMLEEEIRSEIENLSYFEEGTEERSSAIDDLAKLYKLKIEEDKCKWEEDERYCKRCLESEQFDEQKKDKIIKLGTDLAGLLCPLIFYGIWMKMGFKFEETGTFTSSTFRSLFSKFKPTKK